MEETQLTPEDHEILRVPLEDYMTCYIEFAGQKTSCSLQNVMGSFYSKEDLPQYCYSIYSLWGSPNKKREIIPKGAVMHFRFVLNSTMRADPENEDEIPKPRYNVPGNPTIQLTVHTPYFLPSPFMDGMNFLGGRAYELILKSDERHLLASPYQTNCTDYLTNWKLRGGKGPMNQMGVVQECRVNKTYEALGCIPLTLDYPHSYNICRNCYPEPCNYSTFAEECGQLADHYTQPCDSISYTATKEDAMITTYEKVKTSVMDVKEIVRRKLVEYDCEGNRIWLKECATIDIDVQFDRFEITNLTYNAKFESLELFSVIGGYMGMWLGISLLTVYDFIGTIIGMTWKYSVKKRRKKSKILKMEKESHNYNHNYYNATKAVQRRKMDEVW